MRRSFALILLLASAAASAETLAPGWVLDAQAWSRPRHGARLLELGAVRGAVETWMQATDRRLVIRYPGGEEGTLWARELHDWLVALGVPSSHIRRAPGYRRPDAVVIDLEQWEGR